MLQDPLAYLEATARQGKMLGLRLGPEAVILVSDQAAARQIMIDQASSFGKVFNDLMKMGAFTNLLRLYVS